MSPIYSGPDGTWEPRWVCNAYLEAIEPYLEGRGPNPGCSTCGEHGFHSCVFSVRQVDPNQPMKHPHGHHGNCVTNPERPCMMGGEGACSRCICRPLRERRVIVLSPQEAEKVPVGW